MRGCRPRRPPGTSWNFLDRMLRHMDVRPVAAFSVPSPVGSARSRAPFSQIWLLFSMSSVCYVPSCLRSEIGRLVPEADHQPGKGRKAMRRLIVILGVFCLGLPLLTPEVAEGHSCSSVCSQVRRACRSVAKATRQVDRAVCDAERDLCRDACEANRDTCPVDCQTASATCTASCASSLDPVACQAACATGEMQCLSDCDNCDAICSDQRALCHTTAEGVRQAANDACVTIRESCGETCVDPIDSGCVKQCKSERSGCDRDAKVGEKQCRTSCPNGTGRRACVRDCRRDKNAAFAVCSDRELVCLAGCAGVSLQ